MGSHKVSGRTQTLQSRSSLCLSPSCPGDAKAQEGKQQDASRPGWSQKRECRETSRTARCRSRLGPGPGVLHPQRPSSASAHPNSPRWRRGVKGGLNQPLNLWTWERGRHHPPATCRYHVEYTHTHLLAQVVYILFLDSKDTEPQRGK